MPFDLDQTVRAMVSAAVSALGKESKKVKAAAREVLEDQRQALKDIAAARLANEIDDAELEVQLGDEQLAFQAGLSMVRALGKASIQKAANAAFDVLARAIREAI